MFTEILYKKYTIWIKRLKKGVFVKKFLFFLMIFGTVFAKENFTVFGASPPATYFLYSFNPKVIAGTNYQFKERELTFVDSSIAQLPVIGGWFGQGNTPNFETLLKVQPNLVLTWNYNNGFKPVDDKLKSLGFKTYGVNIDTIDDYVHIYKEAGEVLGLPKRGETLSNYTHDALQKVQAVKEKIKDKKVVYYAEGVDGLLTECHASIHADLIEYVGAYNPHRCSNKIGYGRERITAEQLMLYDPDVIITQERGFYETIYESQRFKDIKAVKNRAVYLIPSTPFSWFDRPPSFMKILGAQWLSSLLYGDLYPNKIEDDVDAFYQLYLNVKLSNEEIKQLLKDNNGNVLGF